MENSNLIDDQSLEIDYYEEVQIKNKKYIKLAIILSILNTILFPPTTGHTGMPIGERLGLSLYSNFIGIPLVFSILGLLFALFPYKNLTWQQKYKRAVLVPLLFFNTLMFVGLFLVGLSLIYRYYKFGY